MSEIISSITIALAEFFGSSYLAVGLVSMLPMIEARGAIPMALELGIEPWIAYVFCCCMAFLVCPLLILTFKPLIEWLKKTTQFKKVATFLSENFQGKADKIEYADTATAARQTLIKKLLGLYAFVALPLPMTGVWTASLVASFMNLKWYYTLPVIFVGNLTAGGIIALLAKLLGDNSYIIIYVLFAFILITIASFAITAYTKVKKKKTQEIVFTDKKD
ncbi:MAG: small multi-drug export protein, partial [Bacillota bacterium]